jgi:hypothetical protein
MQRKKYKIPKEEYLKFKNQYLFDVLRYSENKFVRYGEAFLRMFPQVVEEYVYIGGDLGEAEAEKLWETKTVNEAEKMILNWIE